MSNLGWVSLHRQIMNNWLWENKPFAYGQAFVDMVLMANHKENRFPLGDEVVVLCPGDFVTSEIKLMNRWGWSKSKVRRFLKLLENDGMIERKVDRKKTTITIVNYSKFQYSETDNRPLKDHSETDNRPLKDTNNNVNNDNNVNNNTTISSEPDKPTPNPSGILLPLNDKTYYDVPLDKIELWSETYPAVDVNVELRRMIAWLDSNPTKRKTRRGIERFINSWLARTQDSGGTKGKEVNSQNGGNTYNSDQNWENVKRAIAKATEGKEPGENIFA